MALASKDHEQFSTHLVCSGHARAVTHICYVTEADYEPGEGLRAALAPDTRGADPRSGPFILSASVDSRPMLRDGVTGDWIGTFEGHKGAVWCIRKALAAPVVATASADFSVKLWSFDSGLELSTIVHEHVVKGVDLTPDARVLASGGMKKTLKLFDVSRGAEIATTSEGIATGIRMVRWIGDHLLAVASGDRGVRVYDARAATAPVRVLATPGAVSSLETSAGGTHLAVASDSTALVFSTASFEQLAAVTVPSAIDSAALDASCSRLVAGGRDFRVYKYDLASPSAPTVVHTGHHGPVHSTAWSPDGAVYASGADDGTLRLWRTDVAAEYGLWRLPRQTVDTAVPAL